MTMLRIRKSICLRSPYLEIIIMVIASIIASFSLILLSIAPSVPEQGVMPTSSISRIILAFFLLGIAVAIISIIAGIGGGVIFTPLMLAFTNINSLVVRGTGFLVAMFSGLISTGVFLKKGLGNYKLCMMISLSQGIGALMGSTLAVKAAQHAGAQGEGLLRTCLGIILALVAMYLFLGGKKLEWPVVKKVDKFTAWLNLGSSYFEESEGHMRNYEVTRAPLGMLLVFIVGIIGGFFGMGGGWAITPSLNLGMGMPLKLAVANSGVILGMGGCISIWPYIGAGSIIPLFVLPWIAGHVIGGFIGSHVLARTKMTVVRFILVGIMMFTAFSLITGGMNIMGLVGNVPSIVQVLIFIAIFACVIITIIINNSKEKTEKKTKANRTAEKSLSMLDVTIPNSQRIYANVIRWVTLSVSVAALFIPIFILVNPSNNILNPNLIFSMILDGASPADIWSMSKLSKSLGTHFYFQNISNADIWAMLTINIGCAVGLLAVIPAVFIQIHKEKDFFNASLGIVMALLIFSALMKNNIICYF